ncbi:MAG: glycerol-3-phosphate acyltransferase [Planctomycetota bacterium]
MHPDPAAAAGFVLAAYLLGATPFALLLGKLHGVDIRDYGSGNVGATNLGRALGSKTWGVVCFFLDLGKGLGPTLAYGLTYGPLNPGRAPGAVATGLWVAVAAAAVLGHIFSPYLKFKGGKGAATGLGATLGLWPTLTAAAGVAFLLWFAVTKKTGYVGLASVLAAASLTPAGLILGPALGRPWNETAVFLAVAVALGALVIFRHKGNLQRLRQGAESRVAWGGPKAKPNDGKPAKASRRDN